MFAWYKMLLLRHLSYRGHCDILMQLQVLLPIVGDGYRIFLLRAFIIDFIFGKQLSRVSSKSLHETLHKKFLFPGIRLASPSSSLPNY